MDFTKCSGKPVAIEYNEKYLWNAKLACYCPYCCLTTSREPTPYKIIQNENGYTEIFDETYYEIKDKKYEEIPTSKNPHDPFGDYHRSPNEVLYYSHNVENEDTDEENVDL